MSGGNPDRELMTDRSTPDLNCAKDIGESLSCERLPSRQHLKKNATEGPDIGRSIRRAPARLFRTHMSGGADENASHRAAHERG